MTDRNCGEMTRKPLIEGRDRAPVGFPRPLFELHVLLPEGWYWPADSPGACGEPSFEAVRRIWYGVE